MITSNQPKMTGHGVPLPTKIMVDSHDTKPTNVKNGAKLKEIDTGKEFIYNEGTSTWDEQPSEGGEGGGGSSTLSGLTDVDISNPSDGQTLVYNSASGKWENGAGGGGVLVLHADMQTGALDKTWQEIYDQVNAGAYCFILNSFNYDGITGLALTQVTSVENQTSMGNGYTVICSFASVTFSAQSPNDYPSTPMG